MTKSLLLALVAEVAMTSLSASANPQLDRGRQAIRSLAGCYLVDYSFAEVESLKAGYAPDRRIYDVNRDKTIKEWIYAEELGETHIRLQHILFGVELDGQPMAGSELRHQAEDWEFDAPYLYDFTGPLNWNVVLRTRSAPDNWTRRITNLDDGLRYQCAAPFTLDTAAPEWTCSNYAPIPGRETRDMGRRDYNALARTTRVMAYGTSWLERQDNVKTVDSTGGADGGTRTPLARELGKTWYIHLPDAECAGARAFVAPRVGFWNLLRDTWMLVLDGQSPFREKALPLPRFMKIGEIEEAYLARDLRDPTTRQAASSAIRAVISEYRD